MTRCSVNKCRLACCSGVTATAGSVVGCSAARPAAMRGPRAGLPGHAAFHGLVAGHGRSADLDRLQAVPLPALVRPLPDGSHRHSGAEAAGLEMRRQIGQRKKVFRWEVDHADEGSPLLPPACADCALTRCEPLLIGSAGSTMNGNRHPYLLCSCTRRADAAPSWCVDRADVAAPSTSGRTVPWRPRSDTANSWRR